MFAINPKKRDWIVAVAYVVFIYATLEVARFPLAFLRSQGWLKLSLGILFFSVAAGVVGLVAAQRPLKWWKFLVLVLVGLAYFFGARQVQTPEEQIHFIEYGLVGLLFHRAFEHDFGTNMRSWVLAFIFACFAGWIDELLQGVSPHRQYDLRDVYLNAFSAGLGLKVYFIVRTPKSPR